jgi:putative PIN family toxin of toxin-antitoxin system
MRVFLDTNVLASALIARGLCADVVRGVLVSHELMTCEEVLEELRRVLSEKAGVTRDIVDEFESLLREVASLVAGERAQVSLGRQDAVILGAALAGNADVFITGDKRILALARVGTLDILSPRDFWKLLSSK